VSGGELALECWDSQQMAKMKREREMSYVITYGTFDLFHVGHLRLLQRLWSVVRKELLYHRV